MGFWIDVDAGDKRLLQKLRSNPSEVFGQPYYGYLLFLAGAADHEIVTWISENLGALDSLTGDDIAFAIFAQRFPITLRTNYGEDRASRSSIGTVSLDEVRDSYSISKLCRSGRFGFVADGDVLTAITYAVDDIARGFGVLGDLPCMIVLDGIPDEKFDVLPLDATATEKLIPLLRKAIHTFGRAPSFPRYAESIQQIVRKIDSFSLLNKQRDADKLRLEALRNEIPAKVEGEITNVTNIRDDLLTGKLKRVRQRLQDTRLLDTEQAEAVLNAVNEQQATLLQYSRTVTAFRRLVSESEWPLNPESLSRYEMCDKYARSLLGTALSGLSGESPDQCLHVLALLEERQQKTIDEVMQRIPNEATLKQRVIDEYSVKLRVLETRLASYASIEKTQEQDLMVALKEHKNLDHPTITKVFAKLARDERLRTVRRVVGSNASVFAGSIFKPETLLKLWAAIT